MKKRNLEGQRFGRLTVLVSLPSFHNKTRWRCVCECGRETEVVTDKLLSGHTQSCGCLRRERLNDANTKHGDRHTRLYTIWAHMRQRCNNPKNKDYKYYGGRGISMCPEWLSNFAAFRDWALVNGYRKDLTIDRIDVNGSYHPDNCRWVTQAEQNKNKRPRRKEAIS